MPLDPREELRRTIVMYQELLKTRWSEEAVSQTHLWKLLELCKWEGESGLISHQSDHEVTLLNHLIQRLVDQSVSWISLIQDVTPSDQPATDEEL